MAKVKMLEHTRTEYQVFVRWVRSQGVRTELGMHSVIFTDENDQKEVIRTWVERQENGLEVLEIVARQREVYISPWEERKV